MISKIKYFIATLSVMVLPVLLTTTVSANNITENFCKGANTAAGESGTCQELTDDEEGSPINKFIKLVIKYFSMIIGAVSVIMIIYGGFKYITSGGNDKNVSGAKNTILYAVIGLVIVALAQVIVRFVLTNASV